MKVVKTFSLKTWPRATIAERLSKSYSERVHVTLHAEFDVGYVRDLKVRLEPIVKEKYNTRLTYTAIFTKLVSHVLRNHIIFNSVIEGDEVKVIDDINISIAVQSEKLGLVTPVIRNVDLKNLGEVSKELNDLVSKAREGKLSIKDLTGGTFTISNIGMLGSVDGFTQIINPPQVAILGIGRIIDKPVVINGEVRVRPTCTFSLTFDHRAIDGYHGAEFLATLKSFLETPEKVVGEV
ncbi:MAG: 2-oxo acid dehydrogenase subunit E2 [Desulfurococcaceae archaeon]|jgi:pyruvate dehydrogenase E2 component (dihydrolipoamide acetyltransferase)|nr:2-oxo acid dehydrogenase subunit E2 [Desulfurococcaceae archaeon]